MPVPQESRVFVEQAGKPVADGILPVADGILPVPQESRVFVQQASCLLLTMVQHLSYIKQIWR